MQNYFFVSFVAWPQGQFIQQIPAAPQTTLEGYPQQYPNGIYQPTYQQPGFESNTFYTGAVQVLTNPRPPSAQDHGQQTRTNGSYAHTPSPVPAQQPPPPPPPQQQPNQRTNISSQYHQEYVTNNQSYVAPATTPTGNIEGAQTGHISRPSSVNSTVNTPVSNANYQGNVTFSSTNFTPVSNSAPNFANSTQNSGNEKPGYPLVNSNPQLASHNSSGYPGGTYSGSNVQEDNQQNQESNPHWSDNIVWGTPVMQQQNEESAKNESKYNQNNLISNRNELIQNQNQQMNIHTQYQNQQLENKPPDSGPASGDNPEESQYSQRIEVNSRIKTMILNKQQNNEKKDETQVGDHNKTGHFLSYSHHHRPQNFSDGGGVFQIPHIDKNYKNTKSQKLQNTASIKNKLPNQRNHFPTVYGQRYTTVIKEVPLFQQNGAKAGVKENRSDAVQNSTFVSNSSNISYLHSSNISSNSSYSTISNSSNTYVSQTSVSNLSNHFISNSTGSKPSSSILSSSNSLKLNSSIHLNPYFIPNEFKDRHLNIKDNSNGSNNNFQKIKENTFQSREHYVQTIQHGNQMKDSGTQNSIRNELQVSEQKFSSEVKTNLLGSYSGDEILRSELQKPRYELNHKKEPCDGLILQHELSNNLSHQKELYGELNQQKEHCDNLDNILRSKWHHQYDPRNDLNHKNNLTSESNYKNDLQNEQKSSNELNSQLYEQSRLNLRGELNSDDKIKVQNELNSSNALRIRNEVIYSNYDIASSNNLISDLPKSNNEYNSNKESLNSNNGVINSKNEINLNNSLVQSNISFENSHDRFLKTNDELENSNELPKTVGEPANSKIDPPVLKNGLHFNSFDKTDKQNMITINKTGLNDEHQIIDIKSEPNVSRVGQDSVIQNEQECSNIKTEPHNSNFKIENQNSLFKSEVQNSLFKSEHQSSFFKSKPESTLLKSEPQSSLNNEPQSLLLKMESQSPLFKNESQNIILKSEPQSSLIKSDTDSSMFENNHDEAMIKSDRQSLDLLFKNNPHNNSQKQLLKTSPEPSQKNFEECSDSKNFRTWYNPNNIHTINNNFIDKNNEMLKGKVKQENELKKDFNLSGELEEKMKNVIGEEIPDCGCFPKDQQPPEPGSYYTHLGNIFLMGCVFLIFILMCTLRLFQ